MQMSSRVQRSLRVLAERIPGEPITQMSLVAALRPWIDGSLRNVSTKVDARIRASATFQRFMTADPADLPITRAAVANLVSLAQTATTRDPVDLAERMDDAFAELVTYRLPDGTCRTCQFDLDLWSESDGTLVLVCGLGCTWSLDEAPRARTIGGTPANRRAVLAAFPAADLLPV